VLFVSLIINAALVTIRELFKKNLTDLKLLKLLYLRNYVQSVGHYCKVNPFKPG